MASSKTTSRLSFKLVFTITLLAFGVLFFVWMEGFGRFLPKTWHLYKPTSMATNDDTDLASLALNKVLQDANSLFGHYSNRQDDLSKWMASYPDSTKIVRMNIPGAHDAATWNYSLATQQSLKPVTDLINKTSHSPESFRCQSRSIIDMLTAGIRAFDLRYAHDVTGQNLVFWHGPALQSQTATLEDVLFGFYRWLDDHPTEVVFLSFQYEWSDVMRHIDSVDEQRKLYDALTSQVAKKFILQAPDTFGTLGAARGKIILLRRFDLNLLPDTYGQGLPGIHFSPRKWTVNSANIRLRYNDNPAVFEEGVAYIEDYYRPLTPASSTLKENIDIKFDAIQTHLKLAASEEHVDGLFWTFTSGTKIENSAPVTPKMMALSDGYKEEGVNQRLLNLFAGMKRKRLGIVMFDFFDEPENLVPFFLSLGA